MFGRGKIEDFTWKGYARLRHLYRVRALPVAVPGVEHRQAAVAQARHHGPARPLLAKAPYILGDKETPLESTPEGGLGEELRGEKHAEEHHVPESGFGRVLGSGPEQATRPLVGTAEQGGVIDPDVLWSCTTCGACVEQCPVDIEHIDHIVDMRRYQVMMESEFPSELVGAVQEP